MFISCPVIVIKKTAADELSKIVSDQYGITMSNSLLIGKDRVHQSYAGVGIQYEPKAIPDALDSVNLANPVDSAIADLLISMLINIGNLPVDTDQLDADRVAEVTNDREEM